MSLHTEINLLQKTRGGDEQAFLTFVGFHKDQLVDFAFQMTGSMEVALDIACVTFARIRRLRKPGSLRISPQVWLLKQAGRLVRRHDRAEWFARVFRFQEGRHVPTPRFEAGLSPGAGIPSWERLLRERLVRRAIRDLKPVQRCVLVLREILALPEEVVSQVLGCSVEDARIRAERARSTYAESFGQIQGEGEGR